MKTAMNIMFAVLMLAGSLNCGKIAELISDDSAVFTLEAVDSKGTALEKGEYRLGFTEAAVMDGAYSGIYFEFKQEVDENNSFRLKIELPSGNRFKVFLKNVNEISIEAPAEKFTLTPDDFRGIFSDRINRFVGAKLTLEKWVKTDRQTYSVTYYSFSDFKITFDKFTADGKKLTAECSFEGVMTDKDATYTDGRYTVKGGFTLRDKETGIMQIE